jgi:hypothetical protein
MQDLSDRVRKIKNRRLSVRRERRNKVYEALRKPEVNSQVAIPEGYCLELVDIEDVRQNGADALNRYFSKSYEVLKKGLDGVGKVTNGTRSGIRYLRSYQLHQRG